MNTKAITFIAMILGAYISLYFPSANPLAQSIGLYLMSKLVFIGAIFFFATQIEAPSDYNLIKLGEKVEHTISSILRVLGIGIPLLGLWLELLINSDGFIDFIKNITYYLITLFLYLEAYSLFFNTTLSTLRGIGIHDPIEKDTANRYDRFFYWLSKGNPDLAGYLRIITELIATILIFLI